MPAPRITLPAADEHIDYYGRYIALVGEDVYAQLESQGGVTLRMLAALDDQKALHRYAPGKWCVKEVVGHMNDGERIFAYRALRIARADQTELPGFDETKYVPAGKFDQRSTKSLAAETAAVRAGTLALFRGLPEEAFMRRGTANAGPVSVRALAAIIAGHEKHHLTILRDRYGVTVEF